MDSNFGFFTQSESRINGRDVMHYITPTPVGIIHIVQYVMGGNRFGELVTFLFLNELEKAEAKYKQIIKGITDGKL